MRLDIDAL